MTNEAQAKEDVAVESGEKEQTPQTTEETESEELAISFGDEPEEEEKAEDPVPLIRELRKNFNRVKAKNAELEAKLKEVTAPKIEAVDPGKKPTLEGCDYDAEKFETKLSEWHESKRKYDDKKRAAEEDQRKQDQEWQKNLEKYNTQKLTLKVRDFEDAEAAVVGKFTVLQQGMIVQGADNPAHVVYALGKNEKIASELAAIKDPVKFAFALAKLETKMKIQPKKSAATPEKTVTGSKPGSSGALDNTLERLRAEADKTGNFDKVLEYKREQKRKKRGR